jgi:regulator of protease activity HflC (stomatin/prohibitin superfamily)
MSARTTSAPSSARARAFRRPGFLVSARTFDPARRRLRLTDPPWRPVAPHTAITSADIRSDPWGLAEGYRHERLRVKLLAAARARPGEGAGLFVIIPIVDRMVRVNLQTVTMDIPPQDVITRDNVTVRVNAVTHFNVVDPVKATIVIQDYILGTSQLAQTTLRSTPGQVGLDDLLVNRDEINQRLQTIIDQLTDPWGVKVTPVEVKDVELPETMRRAMAGQSEAERERRAKVIHSQGEFEAAEQLSNAAELSWSVGRRRSS